MLSYVLALCLVAVMLVCITLRKAYYFLPAKELKRQAETGDRLAALFWRAVAYGPSLRLFLWLVLGFSSAACILLLARVAPPVFGFIAVALLLWVAFAWLPGSRLTNPGVRIAALLTPAVAWLAGALDPVLRTLHAYVDHRNISRAHTGVYVREDLLYLIEKQKSQPDNQLSIEELDIASTALQFGDKKVRDVMVKRKKVHGVDAKDIISPVYLDELHKTLHSSFPVFDGKPEDFVGILYLRELTDVSKGKGSKGKVKDHMSKGIQYVHEGDSLAEALHAFYYSKKSMFIVINSFEEYVGILTIEDILHALLGNPRVAEFDQHGSKKAVAERHNPKPKPTDEPTAESVEEPAAPTTD